MALVREQPVARPQQKTALDLEVKPSAEPNMLIYEIDTTTYLAV